MPKIPDDFRRVLENRVDDIVAEQLTTNSGISSWLFSNAFGACELLSIVSVRVHRDRDYRRASGDDLAYGETDVEVIGLVRSPSGLVGRSALLIENKVDADEQLNQGLRYQARAKHERQIGTWEQFSCVLLAPHSYLQSHYPLGDFTKSGWNTTCSYEDLASRMSDKQLSGLLMEATSAANAWNKPVPSAVQFWKDYALFGRKHHPDVPVFVETQKGSRLGGVWPSFYDNLLRNNSKDAGRKRVQIVHMDTANYVSLFLKKVAYPDFADTLAPILEEKMKLAPAGTSWQSVRLIVPPIDPQQPLELQTGTLHQVFASARRFFSFYLAAEPKLLAIPVILRRS